VRVEASGLSNPVHVALLLVLLGIWLGGAWLAAASARRSGRSFAVYLIAGLIFGPAVDVLVLLLAALLPARRVDGGE
jgi:hypothetical protein